MNWKTSRFDFRSKPSRFVNARCNICNHVSHSEIASDPEDFSSGSFYDDPHGDGFLCDDCYSAYVEQMEDYDYLDGEEDE